MTAVCIIAMSVKYQQHLVHVWVYVYVVSPYVSMRIS